MTNKQVFVVKVGGSIIDDPEKQDDFLSAFAELPSPKVLVHGGGKIATRLGQKMGVKAEMIEGRRVTNKDMLQVVTMTYAGIINKTLVSQLLSRGVTAVGVSGFDGGLLTAVKRPVINGIDFGYVGDVVDTDPTLILTLFNYDFCPVIAPLTCTESGQILNTNADTIARELSSSLTKKYVVNLVYAFELPGVMRNVKDESSLISQIDLKQFESLKGNGQVSDGMLPKLRNAFEALKHGVSKVAIARYDRIGQLSLKTFGEYTSIVQ